MKHKATNPQLDLWGQRLSSAGYAMAARGGEWLVAGSRKQEHPDETYSIPVLGLEPLKMNRLELL